MTSLSKGGDMIKSLRFMWIGEAGRASQKAANTTEQSCASRVAQATPATPQPRLATNTKSNTMLMAQEMARKRKGETESPTPWKMPLNILNSIRNSTPANVICI